MKTRPCSSPAAVITAQIKASKLSARLDGRCSVGTGDQPGQFPAIAERSSFFFFAREADRMRQKITSNLGVPLGGPRRTRTCRSACVPHARGQTTRTRAVGTDSTYCAGPRRRGDESKVGGVSERGARKATDGQQVRMKAKQQQGVLTEGGGGVGGSALFERPFGISLSLGTFPT